MGTKHLREIAAAMHESYDRLRGVPRPYGVADLEQVHARRPVDLSGYVQALRGSPTRRRRPRRPSAPSRESADDLDRIDVLRTDVKLPGNTNPEKAAREARTALQAGLRREVITKLRVPLAATVLEWAAHGPARERCSSTTCSVLARDALRDPEVRAPVGNGTSACSSTSSRTPIRSRSRSRSLLASSRPDIADRRWDDDPLWRQMRGDCSSSVIRSSRSTGSAGPTSTCTERAQTVFADRRSHLTENFRTVESVVDFVNALFDAVDGRRAPRTPSRSTSPLTAHVPDHDTWADGGDDRRPRRDVPAAEVRADEADAVVAGHRPSAKSEGWQVRDPKDGALRPARHADIAVLMPTRASLPALDHGLDAAGIPPRVESRTLIWNTAEVRDLTGGLDRGERPERPGGDRRRFALGRPRLLRPRSRAVEVERRTVVVPQQRSRRRPIRGTPWRWGSTCFGRCTASGGGCRSARRSSAGHRGRSLPELAFAHARPRDRWRRIEFVLAQARAFEEAGGSSIEEFVVVVSGPGRARRVGQRRDRA